MKLKPSVVPGDIGDEHEFSGKKTKKTTIYLQFNPNFNKLF